MSGTSTWLQLVLHNCRCTCRNYLLPFIQNIPSQLNSYDWCFYPSGWTALQYSFHINMYLNTRCRADMPPKATKKKLSSSASASASVKVSCCICCQPIQPDKDEALFCSGSCQQWLHRYCASMSADYYKSAKSDNTQVFCFCCYRVLKEEQLSFLESSIQALEAERSEMKKCTPTVPHQAAVSSNDQPTLIYAAATGGESSDHYTHAVPIPQTGSTNPPHSLLSLNSTRKYNVILYGVDECPTGTSRSVRLD